MVGWWGVVWVGVMCFKAKRNVTIPVMNRKLGSAAPLRMKEARREVEAVCVNLARRPTTFLPSYLPTFLPTHGTAGENVAGPSMSPRLEEHQGV